MQRQVRAIIAAMTIITSASIVSCSSAQDTSAVPSTPPPSIESAASSAADSVAADPIAALAALGVDITESSEASELDAAAALELAAAPWKDSATDDSVATAAKARLSGRLVWVVGVAPVRLRRHGPDPQDVIGQTMIVLDANSGQNVGQYGTGLATTR